MESFTIMIIIIIIIIATILVIIYSINLKNDNNNYDNFHDNKISSLKRKKNDSDKNTTKQKTQWKEKFFF